MINKLPPYHYYYNCFYNWQQFAHMAHVFIRIFNLICMMTLVGHWSACLMFLVPMLNQFPSDCWVAINELQVKVVSNVKFPLCQDVLRHTRGCVTVWSNILQPFDMSHFFLDSATFLKSQIFWTSTLKYQKCQLLFIVKYHSFAKQKSYFRS